MKKKLLIIIISLMLFSPESHAFWIWTPKSGKLINPKYAVKDSPEAQYNYAMEFLNKKDYKRASEEFLRLVQAYKDSKLAPDSQYFGGFSLEEWGKYYRAFEEYQKVINNYPFSDKIDEVIKRQFRIANRFYSKRASKLAGWELMDSLDKALEVYTKVIENAPYGKYSDRAQFKVGQCHKRLQQYNEAITAFQKVIEEYPKSPLIRQARYEVANSTYLASLKSDYDQAPTEEAIEQYKKFAVYGEDDELRREAKEVIDELEEKKAESIYKTALFYERIKHYASAEVYYKEITKKYPNTSYAELARYKLELMKLRSKSEG